MHHGIHDGQSMHCWSACAPQRHRFPLLSKAQVCPSPHAMEWKVWLPATFAGVLQ